MTMLILSVDSSPWNYLRFVSRMKNFKRSMNLKESIEAVFNHILRKLSRAPEGPIRHLIGKLRPCKRCLLRRKTSKASELKIIAVGIT